MKKLLMSIVALTSIISLASCSEGGVSDPITGATGPAGERGEDGVDGINGTDGATWLFGDIAPSEDLGVFGDLYLNTSTYDIYSKTDSGWVVIGNIKGEDGVDGEKGDKGDKGDTGEAGTDGTDGNQWHIGSTDPIDGETEGKPGDLYLNDVTGDIFTMDESNNWRYIGNLKGDKGDTGEKGDEGEKGEDGTIGTEFLSGEGEPEADLGKDGDIYLDAYTSDLYQKVDGVWTLITNLKGEDGKPGEDGDVGEDGTDGATWLTGSGAPSEDLGKVGDLYLDTETTDVYQKGEEGWSLITTLRPEDEGSSFLTGSGVPSADLGKEGDVYLDTATSNFFRKEGGIWIYIGSLTQSATLGSVTIDDSIPELRGKVEANPVETVVGSPVTLTITPNNSKSTWHPTLMTINDEKVSPYLFEYHEDGDYYTYTTEMVEGGIEVDCDFERGAMPGVPGGFTALSRTHSVSFTDSTVEQLQTQDRKGTVNKTLEFYAFDEEEADDPTYRGDKIDVYVSFDMFDFSLRNPEDASKIEFTAEPSTYSGKDAIKLKYTLKQGQFPLDSYTEIFIDMTFKLTGTYAGGFNFQIGSRN